MPALISASFSDKGLHSRGCFEGFRRIGSRRRFLSTHRGGKWSTYYSPDVLALQARFFDCFLKGEDNGMHDVLPVRRHRLRVLLADVCVGASAWQRVYDATPRGKRAGNPNE